jgi:hypothetical protein
MMRYVHQRLAKLVRDLEVGDFVRRLGGRGVGLVEGIADGHATVAWGKDRRDILPVACFRRVRASGHALDRRPV